MPLSLAPLLCFVVGAAQTPVQSVKLAGRDVSVVWVKSDTANEEEVKNWSGWKYFDKSKGTWPQLLGPLKPAGPATPATAPPKALKVTVVPELNTISDGQRLRMLSQEVQAALEAIARVQVSLDSILPADQRISLEVEVVEKTRIVWDAGRLESWTTAQENWGGYDADDHVFRGPYIGSVTILPTHSASEVEAEIFQQLRGASSNSIDWANRWEKTVHQVNKLSLETDVDRGTVLHYTEAGGVRRGKLVLPIMANAPAGKLSFWVKSDSKDDLTLSVFDTEWHTYTLGGWKNSFSSYQADGKWHQIEVKVGAGWNAQLLSSNGSAEKQQLQAAVYDFSDFEFTPGGIAKDDSVAFVPSLTSPKWSERLAAIRAPKGTDPDASAKLVSLLDDPEDLVRIAAIQRVSDSPEADLKINANVYNINGFVSGAALERIAKRKDEVKWELIRAACNPGPAYRRITAARLLAEKKDAGVIGNLAGLYGDQNPDVRAAAAGALGWLDSEEAQKFLTVFFNDPIALVRIRAIQSAKASDPFVRKRLQYAMVNDPYDAVRAVAAVQLASSNEPSVRKEAWKAIRDDSPKTRAMFAYLAPDTAKEFEACVKLALADKDERVRAAVLFRPVQRRQGIRAEWLDVEKLIVDPSLLVAYGLSIHSQGDAGFSEDQKKRIEARRATFLPEKMNFFNYEAFDFL